jgi:putative flavoprotein involved in K+ transport
MSVTRIERVLVVGAGPCGLAIARQLAHEQGIDALILDRARTPAASWRDRYDGFRLNTCGFWSHLPGQHIPRRYGRWPKRDDMIDYFDDYVRRQRLRLTLGVNVIRVDPDHDRWIRHDRRRDVHGSVDDHRDRQLSHPGAATMARRRGFHR